ncbi:hypothetical protein [Pelagicoccus albus]|uniref:Uncharacterized protein n=1 Tax=Pelagicoccus albus TaxID=415222 RepID=A0A7X1B509_9BACT|nr:hypothetical protein [Pelagicoccus albus]MBC2605742.1 hypothetical protein [Pelagicoccus albus]
MNKYTTVEEQIEYGLDTIDPSEKIEMSLRDFMYLHQTIGELNRFFHQPLHYESIEDVSKFLGSKDSGAFAAMNRCYLEIMGKYLPNKISDAFDEGVQFENPNPPYYYKTKAEQVGRHNSGGCAPSA